MGGDCCACDHLHCSISLFVTITFALYYRKSKTEAYVNIQECFRSPAPNTAHDSADTDWTPGFWRTNRSEASEDEETNNLNSVLDVYNQAMSDIASLSDEKSVEPLTFVLVSDWDEATKNEKEACLEKVDEACKAVRKVIAPIGSAKMLQAYREKRDEIENDDLKALVLAYRNAPSRNSKTQILSIYANCYTTVAN